MLSDPYAPEDAARWPAVSRQPGMTVHPRRVRTNLGPRTPLREEYATGDPPVALSPAGLFPRAAYAAEFFMHVTAVRELMLIVGYPSTPERWMVLRTESFGERKRFTREQFARIRADVAGWVDRWIHGRVSARMADVQRFLLDEDAQLWAHRWTQHMNEPGLWNSYGATSLNLLLPAEPALRGWLDPLYEAFLRGADPEAGPSPAPAAAGIFCCFDGFNWCPRKVTDSRSVCIREAPCGIRPPSWIDPYSLEVLSACFRQRDRLGMWPELHRYGRLTRDGSPCSHLELLANLAAHEQRSDYGDAQPVYSAGSHTLSADERTRRVMDFAAAPPDPDRVRQLCYSDMVFRMRKNPKLRHTPPDQLLALAADDPAARMASSITGDVEATITCRVAPNVMITAMRPVRKLPASMDIGVRLSPLFGTAVHAIGNNRWHNPVTCPLWVGPPRRVDVPAGAVVALPSNLVYQISRYQTMASTFSLYKRICLAGSFSPSRSLLAPQRALWNYCWGVPAAAAAEAGAAAEAADAAARPSPEEEYRRHVEEASEAGYPITPASMRLSCRQAEADPDILQRCIYDAILCTYQTRSRIGIRGLNWVFFFMPEVRPFFSLPHQLARALVLRFPEHYPPESTDVLALARRLVAEKQAFRGPQEVTSMLGTLWDMMSE